MVRPSPTSPPFATAFATSWYHKAQGKQSRLSEEGTQWGVATHWRMLGVDAGLMSLVSPGVFLGWWMVGTKILLSLSSKYVLFIVWFFGQL